MKVQVYHNTDPHRREVYHFELEYGDSGQSSLGARHVGTTVSYLDPNGVWGDEWSTYYKAEYDKELRDLHALFSATHGDAYSDVWESDVWGIESDASVFSETHQRPWGQVFSAVHAKYNPVIMKHESGRPYCSSTYSNRMQHPKMPIDQLTASLQATLTRMVDGIGVELAWSPSMSP